MENKAASYNFSDWMMIYVLASALIEVATPAPTFQMTVGLTLLAAIGRFKIYVAERFAPLSQWGGGIVPPLIALACGTLGFAAFLMYINHVAHWTGGCHH